MSPPSVSIPIESPAKMPDVIITAVSASGTNASKCETSGRKDSGKLEDEKGKPTKIVIQEASTCASRPGAERGDFITLKNLALAYALLFLVVKVFQLGREIKAAIEMVMLNTNSPPGFQTMLNEKASNILWRSAYEHNQNSAGAVVVPPQLINEAQVKSDVHVWNTYLAFHSFEYLYAWLLLFAVKNSVPLGIIAWLAFAMPAYCFYLIQVATDILLGDFFRRSFETKAELGIEIFLQSAVILVSLIYLKDMIQSSVVLTWGRSLLQINLNPSSGKSNKPVLIL